MLGGEIPQIGNEFRIPAPADRVCQLERVFATQPNSHFLVRVKKNLDCSRAPILLSKRLQDVFDIDFDEYGRSSNNEFQSALIRCVAKPVNHVLRLSRGQAGLAKNPVCYVPTRSALASEQLPRNWI
jgi:hypothetical protein